jgi:hypothetical protein
LTEKHRHSSDDASLPDASIPDEVLLEEGSGEDDGAAGLKLDARQATEIRQIFLTTLPDYLEPIKQMVEQLVSSAGDDSEVRVALNKTLASMADAASRVSIDDVHQTLLALREDLALWGDPVEPQEPLRERISAALTELTELAGAAADGSVQPKRSETIVAAFRNISGVAPQVLEKLLSAGLVSVDQLLNAERGEIAAVTGLDPQTVDDVIRALTFEHSSAPQPPTIDTPSQEVETPEEPQGPPELGQILERQVATELLLDETRGRLLHLRLRVRELKAELTAAERQREDLRKALLDSKGRVAARLALLSEAESRRDEIERERGALRAKLEQIAAHLSALEAERKDAFDEDARLAQDVSSLALRVDGVLRNLWPVTNGRALLTSEAD